MQDSRIFMTAAWRELLLFNFAVPDSLVASHLPPGVELDRYQGSAYASLVAFAFLDTKVFGLRWPWHTNFAEINLRFYVRRGERRGVCFVREIVPRPIISFFARLLYNEPYVTAPISMTANMAPASRQQEYRLKWQDHTFSIAATAGHSTSLPAADSREHFFKEHEWGFGQTRRGKLLTYRVEHPIWEVRDTTAHHLDFDFAAVYGAPWAILNASRPQSVVWAVGSAIKVMVPE